ncbi:hypothetical protein Ssi03_18950 [Sphaerisporangium siamense]|nr:hypothetical protein Ssi03_18950 [Sphaerisporangium siamense]
MRRGVAAVAVIVLLLGWTAVGAAVVGDSVMCSMSSVGTSVSVSCDDPQSEAEIRAQAFTAEEARAAGCEPIVWDDDDPDRSPGADSDFEDDAGAGSGDGAGVVIDTQAMDEPSYLPRVPDAAVAARVGRAWDRIERWLGAHASATLRKLRFPVEPERVARWEDDHDRRLPDDLYASYLRHDGADGNLGEGFPLPPSYGLLGLAEIDYINWGRCQDLVLEGVRENADPEHGTWHGTLMPVGSDSHGAELFVEPRSGRVGESPSGGSLRYDGPMGWPSYVAMLEELARSLESGAALRDWYPTVTSGCELRWADEPAESLPGGCAGGARPSPSPTPTVAPTPEKLSPAQARASGCLPGRRAPVVRVPDPAVTARVATVWRRIERWLARKAPVTYKTLTPPARPLDIAKAEAAMGLRFPDDLRASLLRHDGSGEWGFGPAPFYDLMSAKDTRAGWKMLCDFLLGGPEEMVGTWWDGHLIPFADAHDGGYLFIDTRTGKTGEYYNESGLTFEGDDVWPSYLALLKATARSLETGRPIRGWRPTVKKGELDWKSTRNPR